MNSRRMFAHFLFFNNVAIFDDFLKIHSGLLEKKSSNVAWQKKKMPKFRSTHSAIYFYVSPTLNWTYNGGFTPMRMCAELSITASASLKNEKLSFFFIKNKIIMSYLKKVCVVLMILHTT